MTLDTTAFDPLFKDHYAPGKIENILFDECPAFTLIKKSGRSRRAGGRKWVQPVQTTLPNRGSSTFATANAQTNGETKSDAFEPTRAKHYRVAKIDNETIEASATGDEDAFQEALDEIDRTLKAEANWCNFRFYRSRGGAIGRMTNTGFATTAMTIDDAAALWAVAKNDVLLLASTDGTSGAVRAGSVTVAGVLHPSPSGVATITTTANIVAGVAAAAANDFIFLDGDFGLAPAGLADYCPDTDAAAITTLFSFDRSVDNRLGGSRVDGTGMSIADLITEMCFKHMSDAGMSASGQRVLFAHPFTMNTLTKQMDAKTVLLAPSDFAGSNRSAPIGIQAWRINVAGVDVNIVLDRMCPVKRLYLINLKAWSMFYANSRYPAFLTERVSVLKIAENGDSYECRVGGYLNNVTSAPHTNVVGLVP